jgi:hypothetical protein
MSKNETYSCGYCEAEFTLKRNLIRHTKTSKKCLDARENNIECLWCKDTFMNKEILKKHKCEVNKDEYLKSVMAQRDIEINSLKETISYLKDEINSLRDKLLQIADKNNTTINNTAVTYNVALVCDKPLRLDKQRVLSLMISNCYPNYIIRGEQGLADWFLDCVCRNEEYNL